MSETKLFTWSEYTHWNVKLQWPSDGAETYRVALVIGIWHAFIWIPLWKTAPWTQWDKQPPEYGLAYHNDIFWVYLGADKWWTLDMPWQWEIVRHDLLLPDGTVYESNRWNWLGKRIGNHYQWYEILTGWSDENVEKDLLDLCTRVVELDHYTKDGRRQQAKITLKGEEREWRLKWFKWLPYPNKTLRVVDCSSDIELGERAGSWKGGMMGWSIPWEKNESMKSTFYRWYKKWDGN